MDSDTQAVFLWIITVIGLVLIVMDYITTVKGMGRGLKEEAFISRILFKKFGIALSTFIKAGFLIVPLAIFSTFSLKDGLIFSGIITVGEAIVVLHNLSLLKKTK